MARTAAATLLTLTPENAGYVREAAARMSHASARGAIGAWVASEAARMARRDLATAFYPERVEIEAEALAARGHGRAGDLDRPRGGRAGKPDLPAGVPHGRRAHRAAAFRATGGLRVRTTQLKLPAILPARAARGAALVMAMACALAAAPAAAMQVLDAVDHAELTAEVSATAVSRIALGNDRIARVIRAPGGFETEHDPGSGDLYLRPLGTRDAGAGMDDTGDDAPETAPVSLFIGTEKGFTYRLTLTRAMRGSAQILIRNAAAQGSGPERPGGGRSADRRPGAPDRRGGAPRTAAGLCDRGRGGRPGRCGRNGLRPFGDLARAALRGPCGRDPGPDVGWRNPWRTPFRGPGDAAAVAARLGPGIAAAWLAGPGTGPSGGRIAVTVRERAAPVSGGASR